MDLFWIFIKIGDVHMLDSYLSNINQYTLRIRITIHIIKIGF